MPGPRDDGRHLQAPRMGGFDISGTSLNCRSGNFLVTEGLRLTYTQDWTAYNKAQVEEKDRVRVLLASLCDGIEQPEQKKGRPRLPLRDAVYGATMKVYGTMSGRRSSTDLRACETAGHMTKAPKYNTVFKYMEQPSLLPLLRRLVDESARPLAAIEQKFAADATGFATQTYVRWFDYAHGTDRPVQRLGEMPHDDDRHADQRDR